MRKPIFSLRLSSPHCCHMLSHVHSAYGRCEEPLRIQISFTHCCITDCDWYNSQLLASTECEEAYHCYWDDEKERGVSKRMPCIASRVPRTYHVHKASACPELPFSRARLGISVWREWRSFSLLTLSKILRVTADDEKFCCSCRVVSVPASGKRDIYLVKTPPKGTMASARGATVA